jgi:hypothetical protein
MPKTITLEVDFNDYNSRKAERQIFLEVEDSDDIHVVKNKIEDKIGSRGDPADRHLFFNGEELKDGSTLANNNIKNKSIISMRKHRIVFGMKWVDVGDEVPKSLTEIKWPELAALVSKGLVSEGAGKGVVDLAQDAFRERASEILTLPPPRLGMPILWLDKGNTKPNQGHELKNQKLSDELKLKKEFTSQELTTFGIQDFCMTDYVKVGSSYFQPGKTLTENECIKVGSRYDGRMT